MHIRKTYLCLLLTSLVYSGCVKRDLEERPQQGYAEIVLDWKDNTPPSEVCYLFYGENGQLVRESIGSSTGITEKLPAGTYHVVAYNCDAQQVGYRGLDHHHTAEVFAQETQTGKTSSGQPQILEPRSVFTASSCQDVGELRVESGKTLHRKAAPKPLTKEVKFRFTVINADRIDALSGVLNGIAPSISLTTGKSNFTQVAFTSFTGVSDQENSCTINLSVFDLLASEHTPSGSNTIDITLEADKKKYEFTTDLTGALEEIMDDNGGIIPIEIPLEIEITIQEINGGITATVKPWDNSGTGSGEPRPTSNITPLS